jgi:GTP-binding protein LepA
MNYEFKKYEKSDLVKLDILLNNETIEALSMILHKTSSAYK